MAKQLYLAAVLMVTAVLYEVYRHPDKNPVIKISSVWKNEISKPAKGLKRILTGVNANIDLIVPALSLLKALNVSHTAPSDHSSLNSVMQLEQLVSFSMLHCAGIERVFSDPELFTHIVQVAETLPHTRHVGGNAALIAQKMKSTEPSLEVQLIGPVGNKLKSLLRDDLLTPTFVSHSREEVHVILEYSSGAEWGKVESSCANRVIFSHDVSNSKMTALESIPKVVRESVPDLAVLSGAHLLEGQGRKGWELRLKDIAALLEGALRSVPVHWELATVGNMDFLRQLIQTLLPRIESLGLNEQELLSVAKSCNAPFDFDAIPQKPGIEWVADLLHWLMHEYGVIGGPQSILTRVHLHTLSFHVIATVEGGPWSNNKEAVMAGAQVAGLQACGIGAFSPNDFRVILPEKFHVSKTDSLLSTKQMAIDGWTTWSREGILYYMSPVLVCKQPAKTVGLGDAVSSLGLLYSQFNQL